MALLDVMEEEDFCLNYHKTMEYIQPKLQRTEFNTGEVEDVQININYIKSKSDEKKDKISD